MNLLTLNKLIKKIVDIQQECTLLWSLLIFAKHSLQLYVFLLLFPTPVYPLCFHWFSLISLIIAPDLVFLCRFWSPSFASSNYDWEVKSSWFWHSFDKPARTLATFSLCLILAKFLLLPLLVEIFYVPSISLLFSTASGFCRSIALGGQLLFCVWNFFLAYVSFYSATEDRWCVVFRNKAM